MAGRRTDRRISNDLNGGAGIECNLAPVVYDGLCLLFYLKMKRISYFMVSEIRRTHRPGIRFLTTTLPEIGYFESVSSLTLGRGKLG